MPVPGVSEEPHLVWKVEVKVHICGKVRMGEIPGKTFLKILVYQKEFGVL